MKWTYDGYRFKGVHYVHGVPFSGELEIIEHNRHLNPSDLRWMIFQCYDYLTEYDAESATYTVHDFKAHKNVLSIEVKPDEWFDGMFNVYVNAKFYGVIDTFDESPWAKLIVLYEK